MQSKRLGKCLLILLALLAPALCAVECATAQHTIDTESRSAEDTKRLGQARNLHNRSRHHYDYGRYDDAIADIKQAKLIIEQVEGADSPLVTTFINNLAYYYMAKGELFPVEALFVEVVERTQKTHGEDSIEAALAEVHLADFWKDRGQADKSEALYATTLARLERASETVDVRNHLPGVLRKLGASYASRGALAEAEQYFLRALSVAEDLAGKGHESTGSSINSLAVFYSVDAGRYEEAESLLIHLLSIIEPIYGPSGPVWAAKENLGMSYLRSGKYEKAEALLKERYEFERGDPFLEEMGSPKLAHSASRLGELYWAMGKMKLAVPLWKEAGERYSRHENAALAIGNEQERLQYAAGLVDNVNAMLSMHLFGAAQDPQAAEMALIRILQTKGRVMEAQADTYRATRENLSARDKQKIQRLAELRGALAYWAHSGQDDERVKEAQVELAEIESSLAEKSSALTDINAVVQIDAVRRGIPEDAALVEFIRYQPFDVLTRTHQKPRYAVYCLTKDGAPVGMDLGSASGLEASVDGFRETLATRGPLEARSNALHEALVKPWLSRLAGKKHLILAPDGLLNLLPFEVISGGDGKPLLQSHRITYLNCGRQLSSVGTAASASHASVIIGDPQYSAGAGEVDGETTPSGKARQWERLPGTAEEARVVHGLLQDSKLLVEGAALEQTIKQVDSPLILHIATHGFFLGASALGGSEASRGLVVVGNHSKQQMQSAWSAMDNPLLRSGLVLAGANQPPGDGQDGLLTALEVTSLDLIGTQLVVMSACDTGVGEITSGEGVFGLRRAMELAGAESQVLSLWQVSDKATTELMKRFYSALVTGSSRADALRDARLSLAQTSQWSHPYYWGAFILSGDWRPLR